MLLPVQVYFMTKALSFFKEMYQHMHNKQVQGGRERYDKEGIGENVVKTLLM